MKTNLLVILLLLTSLGSFAQRNLYTFNDGILYSEENVKAFIDTMELQTPLAYQLTPTIYHKAISKDTIVNFLTFSRAKLNGQPRKKVTFKYEQDSLFLLLHKKLPGFSLSDLYGTVMSSDELQGKPTLINFWNTQCKPCIAEMPQLSKLKDIYGAQMNFIAITDDRVEEEDLVGFLKNKEFNFAVLANGGDYAKSIHISGLPRNIFVDKTGIVRYIQHNYPLDLQGKEIPPDSPDNEFTKIIKQLVGLSK